MQVNVNKLLPSKHLKRRLSFTLFAIIALAICLKLGFWQLARAEQKRQLLNTPQTTLYQNINGHFFSILRLQRFTSKIQQSKNGNSKYKTGKL